MSDNHPPPTEKKIRVLWLAKGLGQGGMERLLVTHAQFGDRKRFDYQAAYLVDRPHSVIGELEALGVPVHRLGNGTGRNLTWPRDLLRLVREQDVDIVHAHSPLPAAIARLLVRFARLNTVMVYTEHNRWSRYSRPTRLANQLTFGQNKVSLAVSEECRESIPERQRAGVTTLIHGVDVEGVGAHRADHAEARQELGVSDGALLVGTVANLRAQKNYPLLLEAAGQVRSERPDVVFVAIGQGPLEEELNDILAASDLGDGFRFLGFRSDVHRLMSGFDILCFSSSHEGLPVALMEARALGLPVVATAVGGLRDHIADGRDGRLVPPDDVDELATAILSLAGDPELRLAMAGESAAAASAYRADKAIAKLESAYLEVLEETSP